MRNFLIISDLHGKRNWINFLFSTPKQFQNWKDRALNGEKDFINDAYKFNAKKYDKIIFLGDYVDSISHTDEEILDNLLDIILLRRSMPERVVLLLGNHDMQYINPKWRCSGFRHEMYSFLSEIFKENADIFKPAHVEGNYIFSHAGITNKLWHKIILPEIQSAIEAGLIDFDPENPDIAQILQFLYDMEFDPLFQAGRARGGMTSIPGIFWCDERELRADPLRGLNQIVGHSRVQDHKIVTYEDGTILYFIDCYDESPETYFEISIENRERKRPFKSVKLK